MRLQVLFIIFVLSGVCCFSGYGGEVKGEGELKQALDTLMMGRYSGFKAAYEGQCRRKQAPNEHFKENLIEQLDGMVMRLSLRLELEKEVGLRAMLDKMLDQGAHLGGSLVQQDLGLVNVTEVPSKGQMIEANCGEVSAYTLAYKYCLEKLADYEKEYEGYLRGE